ncbi:M20 family metallopeptidase [Polaromonas sp.]|uniref:M20 family metallopeptidase n=1 Tax=Polaromonas sp. TaxID=1869339 RepID=UPI0018455D7B|nr:M20 family metallopeptidase [Polaromonas sp.]NMM08329.1 M20 family metallopeptidase [Polaromonas sp.]
MKINLDAITEGALLARIRRWIEIETPSRNGSSIASLAELIGCDARDAGLVTTVQDLGPEIGPLLTVSHRRKGDRRDGILVLAHLDTVHPLGTLERNSFRIEGDRVYGPGSYDMKAGACVALEALKQVLRHSSSSALPIDMVFVPDEEIGSTASRPAIERIAAGARYALVCEPARHAGRCVTARKGIGGLRLSAHGCAAHAGLNHDRGRNAIRELAHQVLQLEAMTDYARGVTVNVGTIEGGTGTNVVPEFSRLAGEFRMPTQALAVEIQSRLLALQPRTPDVTLEVEAWIKRPPYEKTAATALLLAQAQRYATGAGFELDDVPMTGGASDGNFTAALGIPTLDGLGVPGDGAHAIDEHFYLSSLTPRLAFWTSLLNGLT